MSIFKSTFKPFVARQINARQDLISKVERPVEFSHYVSSKSPWIKMTSLVNYNDSADKKNVFTDTLAKQNILFGGSLFNIEGDKYALRSGVGKKGSAYGGDLGTKQYGIRPMPGITGLTSRSAGAYGSLTEIVVKFVAWDVDQFEKLSILYLRPGYKVVVEWGWSMYLDTRNPNKKESICDEFNINDLKHNYKYSIVNSPLNTIDCFNTSLTQESIYNSIDKLRISYSGNYDAFLGAIRNFEYQLLPNGGYECSLTLISIGDVIDTIRINNTTAVDLGPATKTPDPNENNTEANNQDPDDKLEIKSQFEILFDLYCKISDTNPRATSPDFKVIRDIDALISQQDAKAIDTYIYKYNDDPELERLKDESRRNNAPLLSAMSMMNNHPFIPAGKRDYYYIQFGYLLHILNSFKNIYTNQNETLINIEIPPDPKANCYISNGLCVASYNSISINPAVALISNPSAELFSRPDGSPGFIPDVSSTEDINNNTAPLIGKSTITLRNYLYPGTNLGQIANIYINIGEIINTYKELSLNNNGHVNMGPFISSLLNRVSYALGSINEFDKFVKDNKIVIIDKHYTELPSETAYVNKYQVNISGANSIVRNHKVLSKIFNSQATIIAIAAQNRENISALQTATYNYLNNRLQDRLMLTARDEYDGQRLSDEIRETDLFIYNLRMLIRYVNKYVLSNTLYADTYGSNLEGMNTCLNSLLVQIDRATDYKGIVPMTIEMTIDGISGLTIGEIFTVNKDVLPKDYDDRRIGFIVTGISNNVNTHSWETTISTQVCLLDQESKQKASKEKSDNIKKQLIKGINKASEKLALSINSFNVLSAFFADVLNGKYIKKGTGSIGIISPFKTNYLEIALNEYPIPNPNNSSTGNATSQNFLSHIQKFLTKDNTLSSAIKSSQVYNQMDPILQRLFNSDANNAINIKDEKDKDAIPRTARISNYGSLAPQNTDISDKVKRSIVGYMGTLQVDDPQVADPRTLLINPSVVSTPTYKF